MTRSAGLFEEHSHQWGAARVHVRFEDALPDPALTTNVRMLCFTDGGIVVVTTAEFGPTPLPGGTMLEGETLEQALQRELAEEVGARAVSWSVLARLRIRSEAAVPYKPHFPHPVIHQAVCAGWVELIGEPTNPDDGETVTNVDVLELDEACRRLEEAGATWDAAVVRWVVRAYARTQ